MGTAPMTSASTPRRASEKSWPRVTALTYSATAASRRATTITALTTSMIFCSSTPAECPEASWIMAAA